MCLVANVQDIPTGNAYGELFCCVTIHSKMRTQNYYRILQSNTKPIVIFVVCLLFDGVTVFKNLRKYNKHIVPSIKPYLVTPIHFISLFLFLISVFILHGNRQILFSRQDNEIEIFKKKVKKRETRNRVRNVEPWSILLYSEWTDKIRNHNNVQIFDVF